MKKILEQLNEDQQKRLNDILSKVVPVGATVLHEAKNPFTGSYESQGASMEFKFDLSEVKHESQKLVVLVMNFLSREATYLQWWASGLIKQNQYAENMEILRENTTKMLKAVL